MSSPESPVRAPQPAGDAWRRLLQVLTSPGQAMAAVAEQPAILAPYLVWMVVGLAVHMLVFYSKLDLFVAEALKQVQAQGSVPPEQLEAMPTFMRISLLGGAAVTGLAMPWIGGLYYAGMLMLFGSFTGEAGKFKQYLSVAGYAAMPVVLGILLKAPLMLQASSQADLAKIGFHLGALVPGATGAKLGALAAFDLFGLWSLALVMMGFAAIHRTKPARAIWIALFFLALRVLGGAGSMAMSAGFGGLGG